MKYFKSIEIFEDEIATLIMTLYCVTIRLLSFNNSFFHINKKYSPHTEKSIQESFDLIQPNYSKLFN